MSENERKPYYYTFGSDHHLADCYTVIAAESIDKAREKMVGCYGAKWAFEYRSAEEAGVEKWGLRFVVFGTPNERDAVCTPTPWRAEILPGAIVIKPVPRLGDRTICAWDTWWVEETESWKRKSEEDEPNAHRIVAAVNACEGISNEALETGAIDKLRSACNTLCAAYEKAPDEHGASIDWEDLDAAYALAREALGL